MSAGIGKEEAEEISQTPRSSSALPRRDGMQDAVAPAETIKQNSPQDVATDRSTASTKIREADWVRSTRSNDRTWSAAWTASGAG